ncbi:MAG: SUMF1/EgtB/PvdO family nonheme iron enzyme [Chloroflexi bacterium]|nr:SUMF1/EgtB/PvdO family nonheme iron enzyme [Chloroflexota bacterium]
MTTPQKGRIFISYRRADSAGYAGRIYDRLVAHFGEDAIFMDVDAIEGGLDFVKVLEDAVQSCDVLIALIGKQWLNIKDKEGKRRLDNPEDFVRIEIATALDRDIRVIPVLVDGIDMPHSTELPENLKALARRNALQINHHSFNPDVHRLIQHSESALNEAEESKLMKAAALQAEREKAEKEAQIRAKIDKDQEKGRRKHNSKLVQRSARQAKRAERKYKWDISFSRIRYRLAVVFDYVRLYYLYIFLGLFLIGVIIYSLYYASNIIPIPSSTSEPTKTKTIIASATDTQLVSPTEKHQPTSTLTPIPPTKTLSPTPTPLLEEISDIDLAGNEIPMRLVPAGEFIMGSDDGDADERPMHDVYLDAYYIDRHEVTNALFKACVETGTCQEPTDTTYYSRVSGAQKPVVYVTWGMAETYCEWRGSRLPTEAEWEKAARGTDGRVYPWGSEDSCKHANYSSCQGDIIEVGYSQYSQSPYGIYDMTGNVWEWVSDWYLENYYQKTPSDNPLGPTSGNSRVVRGGSWETGGDNVTTSERGGVDRENNKIGFRCAKDTP